jgi:hypothetical protein
MWPPRRGPPSSLLWQVPALSLTAQAFLLTLALSHGNDNLAKLIASALSMLIAIASSRLMRNQRDHARNHGELALRISRELRLASQFGTLNVAEPPGADAETVWAGWDRRIYGVWRATLISFLIADMVVIFSRNPLSYPSLALTCWPCQAAMELDTEAGHRPLWTVAHVRVTDSEAVEGERPDLPLCGSGTGGWAGSTSWPS